MPEFVRQLGREDAAIKVNRWITDSAVDLFIRTFSLVEFATKEEILIRSELQKIYARFPSKSDWFSVFVVESNQLMVDEVWSTQLTKLAYVRNCGVHNNFVNRREDLTITIDGVTFDFPSGGRPITKTLQDNLLLTFETRKLYRQWQDKASNLNPGPP